MKTDTSIHKICITSIKRKTIKPYDFKWTRFYENIEEFSTNYSDYIELKENEIPICSTIIDNSNWSFLTTKRILTKENGNLKEGRFKNAVDKSYGFFKGGGITDKTFGIIQLEDNSEMKYFIETGKASMIMIYGIKTRLDLEKNPKKPMKP